MNSDSDGDFVPLHLSFSKLLVSIMFLISFILKVKNLKTLLRKNFSLKTNPPVHFVVLCGLYFAMTEPRLGGIS